MTTPGGLTPLDDGSRRPPVDPALAAALAAPGSAARGPSAAAAAAARATPSSRPPAGTRTSSRRAAALAPSPAGVIPPDTPGDDDAASPASAGTGRASGSRAAATTPRGRRCNCKKSRCLKLYCDCFAAGGYCTGCACQNCHNSAAHVDLVAATRAHVRARNPAAFQGKIVSPGGAGGATSSGGGIRAGGGGSAVTASADAPTPGALHRRGCNCRKSRCTKKYCECFQAGVLCGSHCKCEACANGKPGAGGGGGGEARPGATTLVVRPRPKTGKASPRTLGDADDGVRGRPPPVVELGAGAGMPPRRRGATPPLPFGGTPFSPPALLWGSSLQQASGQLLGLDGGAASTPRGARSAGGLRALAAATSAAADVDRGGLPDHPLAPATAWTEARLAETDADALYDATFGPGALSALPHADADAAPDPLLAPTQHHLHLHLAPPPKSRSGARVPGSRSGKRKRVSGRSRSGARPSKAALAAAAAAAEEARAAAESDAPPASKARREVRRALALRDGGAPVAFA